MRAVESFVTEKEHIIRVDENGRILGEEEKVECHTGEGRLHSAYLVMLYDASGRLMLARRSRVKMLWPGFWDGTVASHYHLGEDRMAGVRNRVRHEMGAICSRLEYRFRFRYRSAYLDIGVEDEICDVFRCTDLRGSDIRPDPEEVSDFRFHDPGEVEKILQDRAGELTPWFILAWRRDRELRA